MTMARMSFRKLDAAEEAKFRKASRETYEPFSEINGLWHPVCQDECVKINTERSVFVDERKTT